jgi:hypothetical protein
MDRLRAGALPEIGGLQFQHDGQSREITALQARGHLLAPLPQRLFRRDNIADVGLEGGLVGNDLGAALGLTFPLSLLGRVDEMISAAQDVPD